MEGTHLAGSLESFCHRFCFLLFLQSVGGRTLKTAEVMFQHGDRTPFESFPTDAYKENNWPQGFAQLTKTGIQEHYELGQYLRKRYADFLSFEYRWEEIFVRSTDYDQTITSALATLAGLYPPAGSQIWNPEILWHPIPVHTVPQSQDYLHSPIPDCPRYNRVQNQTMKSKKFQKALKPYRFQKFLNTMATYTGYDVATLKNLTNWKTFNVHNTLKCEIAHNYTLPSWVTEDVLAKMEKLSELTFLSLYGIYKKKREIATTRRLLDLPDEPLPVNTWPCDLAYTCLCFKKVYVTGQIANCAVLCRPIWGCPCEGCSQRHHWRYWL